MAANFSYRPEALAVYAIPFILAFGGSADALLLFFFTLFRSQEACVELIKLYVNPAVVIDFAKAGAALFTILQTARFSMSLKESSSPSDAFPAKPMLFPCRTSHTRMFPKTHSFSYSYLWVGVPVGWKGSIGGMLSSDDPKKLFPWYMRLFSLYGGGAWHTVNGDEYLGRGHVDGGLEKKLQNYLQSQGIDYKEYPYAYLLTAPKFLGYVSNPVSIWNLYSESKELKAFILEVNNTFDERHIYFVNPELVPSTSPDLDIPPKLVNTWPKDFYVSTFNSRAGNYSISATDPLFPSMTNSGVINTTITLRSTHASLVARVFSTGPAIDPASMSLWGKTKFLAIWWWVGFATFPRTVVQALTLLLKRKMAWVFRPEPRRNTMPRHADATELTVERLFSKYLRNLVETCEYPVVVKYSPAGLVHGEEETMTAPADGEPEILEFKVLTPSFYSRFLHYSDTNLEEALITESESATISISSQDLLSKLANNTLLPENLAPLNPLEHPRFWAIQNLRNKPLPIEDVASSAPPSPTTAKTKFPTSTAVKEEVPIQLSPLESFILTKCSAEERSEYASRVLKLFISEYIAFGWMELLDLEIFLIRSRVAWVVAGLLIKR